MRLTLSAIVLISMLMGCASQPRWQPERGEDLFKPTAMRVHPVFTQVRDWTGDGRPDGVELLLEFQDQFGDSAKAAGDIVIEINEYRPGYPDPRGSRAVAPFLTSSNGVAKQRDHWSRTSRCYIFQLAWSNVNQFKPYVITATFEPVGGGPRFTDRFVLEPIRKEPATPPAATSPATQPGTRIPQP